MHVYRLQARLESVQLGIIITMINKRRLHHLWTKLRFIKPWHFLVVAVLSAGVCIMALRANNQQMVLLRQAVYNADKNNGDVQKPLKELQAYVTTHMNTNLNAGQNTVYPPIQLKYTYERLVQAQNAQAAEVNAQLYSTAQAVCEQQHPAGVSGSGRIPCIEQYIQSHKPTEQPTIPEALYKFSFASPKWSPDLAGWSMMLAGISFLLSIVTWIIRRLLRRYL